MELNTTVEMPFIDSEQFFIDINEAIFVSKWLGGMFFM